jgi:hypothetical protein
MACCDSSFQWNIGVGLDALAIVHLGEELDMAGEREHRPGGLAQHRLGHVVRLRQEGVASRHALGDHRLDAAEQLLVLQFLVGKPHKRFERDLIAEPVFAADLQHLGPDIALD